MRTAETLSTASGAAAPAARSFIPGGDFTMGSDAFYAEERPVHQAAVDRFWMDTRPVTVADFRRFVTATGCQTVSERPPRAADDPGADPDGRHPEDPASDVLLLDGYEGTSSTGAFPAARQGEAVDTSAGHIGFRCIIRSGPLLARPGWCPAARHHSTCVTISGCGPSMFVCSAVG